MTEWLIIKKWSKSLWFSFPCPSLNLWEDILEDWNKIIKHVIVWETSRWILFFLDEFEYLLRVIVEINPSRHWNLFKGLISLGIYYSTHIARTIETKSEYLSLVLYHIRRWILLSFYWFFFREYSSAPVGLWMNIQKPIIKVEMRTLAAHGMEMKRASQKYK